MQLIVLTFVLIVGIIYGLYWVFVERAESHEHDALRKRLKRTPKTHVGVGALLKQPQKLSELGVLDAVLGGAGRLVNPVQRTITESGVNISVGSVFLASGCLAGLAYIAVIRFLHLPLVGLGFAIGASFIPFGILRMLASRRMAKFEEQFPEAIDLLARALRAGHALTSGLSMVADEMREPVGPEFRQLFDQQNFGMPLPEALRAFAERIPILDAKFFVTAVLTQREAGGNLSEVLDNLSSVIRDRQRVKRQMRVLSAHGRITGWVLICLPPCLALALMTTSPEHRSTMFGDPFGIQMMVAAAVLQLIGTVIINRIVNVEY